MKYINACRSILCENILTKLQYLINAKLTYMQYQGWRQQPRVLKCCCLTPVSWILKHHSFLHHGHISDHDIYSVSRFVFVDIGGRLQMIPSSDQSLYNHQNWAKLSPDPRRVKKSYQFRNHYKTNSGIEWLCCSCCSSRLRYENWSSDLRWS